MLCNASVQRTAASVGIANALVVARRLTPPRLSDRSLVRLPQYESWDESL